MANTANVAAGKPKIGGAVSVAPKGTTLPTDATTALGGSFTGLGYVSDGGITQSVSRENNEVKAYGGDTVLTTQTGFKETFKFVLLEILDPNVKKIPFGSANVTGALATGITTKVNSKELEEQVFVFDQILNGAVDRIVVPHGKVTEIGDIVYVDGDPVGYDVTVTAFPDTSNNCSYQYTQTDNSQSL